MILGDLGVDVGTQVPHLLLRGVAADGVVDGTKGVGCCMDDGQAVVLSDADVVDGVMGVAGSGVVAGMGCGVVGFGVGVADVAFVSTAVVADGIVDEQAVVLEGCATLEDRPS